MVPKKFKHPCLLIEFRTHEKYVTIRSTIVKFLRIVWRDFWAGFINDVSL